MLIKWSIQTTWVPTAMKFGVFVQLSMDSLHKIWLHEKKINLFLIFD